MAGSICCWSTNNVENSVGRIDAVWRIATIVTLAKSSTENGILVSRDPLVVCDVDGCKFASKASPWLRRCVVRTTVTILGIASLELVSFSIVLVTRGDMVCVEDDGYALFTRRYGH